MEDGVLTLGEDQAIPDEAKASQKE